MHVALVTEVFHDDTGRARLLAVMHAVAARGAELAILPELPLNAWAPSSTEPDDSDAEEPGGPRQTFMSEAAESVGVGLVGGAIVRDPESGQRHNTALAYDGRGRLAASYRKVHLPNEEGYWETCHYVPGTMGPQLVEGFSMPCGLQVCSDVNRPQGFQLLAAQGAEVVFAPRAAPGETWERWALILRANAIMASCYVISVNRPRSEGGAPIGGPSVVIDPFGKMIVATNELIHLAELDPQLCEEARRTYPGYLDRFPDVYSEAWRKLGV